MKRGILILAFVIIGFLGWGTSFAWGSWQYAESETETTTTSTSYVTKVQEAATSSGTYLILASWELGINDTAAFVLSRVVHNTTTIGDYTLQTFDGSTRYRTFAFHSLLSLAAGDTIKITYATNNDLYSARIKRARILLIPLNGMEYATGTGLNVMNLGTTWSNAASTSITPATAGDYLVIASVDIRPNSSVASGECQVDLDGSSTWDLMTMEGKSTSDRVPYFSARVVHLSASAHTLWLQARSAEGAATDIFSPRISVIRLSRNFNDFSQGELLAEDSTTTGTDNWVNRLSQVHYPFQPGRYLVLGSSFVKSLPDISVIPEQRWTAGGQEENKFLGIMKDSTDFLPFVGFKVFNWNSAPETLKVDYTKYSSGSEWVHIRDARMMAISEQLWTGYPVLDSIGPKGLVEGDTLKLKVHAKDPDADPITLSALNVPSHAVFTDSGNGAGSLVFVPAFNQAGVYNLTFIASDTTAKADSEVVQITVTEFGNHPPVLDSIGPKGLAEGDTLRFKIHASDLDEEPLVLTATNVPTHASFVDSGNGSGSFVFAPSFTQSGIYNVTFKSSDPSGGVDSEVVQITVYNVNRPPVLEAIGSKNVTEGGNLSFRIHASDPDGDPLTLSAINTPTNATFMDSGNGSGSFVFDPDYAQAGVYSVTFIAADTFLAADSEIVQIMVNNANRPPVLDSIGPKTIHEGDSLVFSVSASDSDGTIPVLAVSNLPDHATFVDYHNGHGLFRFYPTYYQAGVDTVTFEAIDMSNPPPLSDLEKVVITILDVNQPPAIDTIGPKTIQAGHTLHFRVVGRDPTDPHGGPLHMTAVDLPLNSAFHDSGGGVGGFTFTPDYSQAGVDTITFFCTDEGTPPLSGFRKVEITVTQGADRPPVLDPIGFKMVTEGAILLFRVHATDPDGTTPILYTSLPLPQNATFVDSGNDAGSFRFAPSYVQAGLYQVTFYAGDGQLNDYEQVMIQVVEAGNQAPVLDSIGPQSLMEGDSLILRIHAVDPDENPITLSVINNPINSSLVDSGNGSGAFRFKPNYNQSGIYTVTFKATDSFGKPDSELVQITVIDAGNQPPVLDSIGPKTITERQWLTFTVTAHDPEGNTPSLRAFDLPPSASFTDLHNGAGWFSYTPSYYAQGIYQTRFEAVDSVDTLLRSWRIVQITVRDSNQFPAVSIFPDSTYAAYHVNEGGTFMLKIIGTDPDSTLPIPHIRPLITNSTLVDSGNGIGLFTFNPGYNQGGYPTPKIYAESVFVVDQNYPADTTRFGATIQIYVYNVPEPPNILPINDTSIVEGQVLDIHVVTTSTVDMPTLKVLGQPTNSSFVDSGNGRGWFHFAPDFNQASVYLVRFVSKYGALTDTEDVNITVTEYGNHAPTLDSIGTKVVGEGSTLSFRVHATDLDHDAITLLTRNVPNNAVFVDSGNGAGSFVFHPNWQQSGTYYVTFIARDIYLTQDSEVVTIIVEEVNQTPVLDSIGPKTIPEGSTLSFRVHGTDVDSDSLVLTATPLPANATFHDSGNGAGAFIFNPNYHQSGTYNVIFQVSDLNTSDMEIVPITVTDVPQPPVLDSIGPKTVTEGDSLKFRIHATDVDGGLITLSVRNNPTNSSFVDSGNGSGTFRFKPSFVQSGIYLVTFKAVDNTNRADSEIVQVTVNDAGDQRPDLILPLPDSIEPVVGDTLRLHVYATDPDGPSLVLSVSGLPRRSAFVDSGNGGGLFKFYPDSTQRDSVYHPIFIASDGLLADSAKVTMHVVSYIRGDANADGKVELGDLVYLINYLYKNGPAPVPLLRGDATCDGIVNLGDVVFLINYLFKSGPAPGC